MDKRIVYQNESGISIIIPTGSLPIEQVALKDVPAGVPFKIVDAKDIPQDRTFRDAWEMDFSEPDGFGIGDEAWFAQLEKGQV